MRELIGFLGLISLTIGCIGLLKHVLAPNLAGFLLALTGTLVGLYLLLRD